MWLGDGAFTLVALVALALLNGIMATNPSFTGGLEEVIVREGETALLECSVDDLDGREVLWVRQGSEDQMDTEALSLGSVSLSGNSRISIVTQWNLQIYSVEKSDEGNYICQITQTDPTMKQFTRLKLAIRAKVDVIEPFTEEYLDATDPQKRIFREGLATAPLDCISSGYPMPRIHWTRISWSNINLEFPVGRTEVVNSMLLIRNLRRNDAGLYKCRARNSGGSDHEIIELVVEYEPEATLTEMDVRKKEGDAVKLQCFVDSNPPPQVTWRRGNQTLDVKQAQDTFHVAEYKIGYLVPEDYGLYSCSATNEHGSSQSFVSISGLPTAPLIISPKISDRRDQYLLEFVEADEGGATISSYTLLYRYKDYLQVNNGTFPKFNNWTREVINSSVEAFDLRWFLLTDLEPSTPYELQMWAQNKFGNGDITTFDFETSDVDIFLPTTQQPSSSEQVITMKNAIPDGSYSNASPKTMATSTSLIIISLFLGYLSLSK